MMNLKKEKCIIPTFQDQIEYSDGTVCTTAEQHWYGPQLSDILTKMITPQPADRATGKELRHHGFITKEGTVPLVYKSYNTSVSFSSMSSNSTATPTIEELDAEEKEKCQ